MIRQQPRAPSAAALVILQLAALSVAAHGSGAPARSSGPSRALLAVSPSPDAAANAVAELAAAADVVLLSTLDGGVVGLDAKTGAIKFATHLGEPALSAHVALEANSTLRLVPGVDGSIFLQGLQPNDELRKLDLSVKDIVASSPYGLPDGLLLLGTKQTRVFGISATDGVVRFAFSSGGSPEDLCPRAGALQPGTLTVGQVKYSVRAVDSRTGEERWNLTLSEIVPFGDAGPPAGPPAGRLVVAPDNTLYYLDPARGDPRWRLRMPSPAVRAWSTDGSVARPVELARASSALGGPAPNLIGPPPPSPPSSGLAPVKPAEAPGGALAQAPPEALEVLLHAGRPFVVPAAPAGPPAAELETRAVALRVPTHELRPLPPAPPLLLTAPPAPPPPPAAPNASAPVPPPPAAAVPQKWGWPQLASAAAGATALLGLATAFLLRLRRRRSPVETVPPPVPETVPPPPPPVESASTLRKKKQSKKQASKKTEEDATPPARAKDEATPPPSAPLRDADASRVEVSRAVDEGNGWTRVGRLRVGGRVLGYGSHGTVVYEGELEGRRVAVKRMLPHFFSAAQREISLLIQADQHPNVVRYYGLEADGQFVYLALELCARTLADYVDEQARRAKGASNGGDQLSETTRGLLRDLVRGVAFLHRLHIVHRDIKPVNVLLTDAGVLKISDMGLGRRLQAHETSYESCTPGTSGWQAPEVLLNGRLTKAVDVFSTGCLLYYVLAAAGHPFGDRVEREANVIAGRSALGGVAHIPEAQALVASMLQRDPALRPTADEVCGHPLFWGDERRLAFLVDASDRIEPEDRDSLVLRAVEAAAGAVLGPAPDWLARLDPDLVANLGKYRKYDGGSLRDLLRVIRNKRNHFRDMPPALQASMGPLPSGFLRYFASRFPLLLLAVHAALRAHCGTDPHLAPYYQSL